MRLDNNIQKKTDDKNNKIKPIVHNIFILDCSQSMFDSYVNSKYNAALGGINEELKLLEDNQDVTFTHSVVEFGYPTNIIFTRWMENNTSPLSKRSHLGNTALNDTIFKTITKVLEEKGEDDKVLLKIFTDGEENSSSKSYDEVRDLIAKAKEKYVTVTFIGTDYDTKRATKHYNLSVGNTMVHDNTARGISNLTNTRVEATMLYSKAVADGTNVVEDFYSKTVSNNE